jgi:hypothetical protein
MIIPADVLILAKGDPNEQCICDTSSIKGETEYKIKEAVKEA